MSPRNLHTREEYLPVSRPPAPIETINGNIKIIQKASYKPLIQKCSSPPKRGRERTITIKRLL